jgi:hypothetical protein
MHRFYDIRLTWVFLALLPFSFGITPCRAAEGPASRVSQVVVVFKTHFDLGYTDLTRKVVERYRTSMIDGALDVCDRNRPLPPESRFVWTLAGWPLAQMLYPEQTPQRRQRIEQAIRDGFLVWHALPGSLHTESLDLEDLVRGMEFSSRLSRRFGQPLPRDAKMSDVAAHTWLLPTLLKHAGVDFLHIGCNSAASSPDVPALFWWEGPDGSRLLTMYTASGYGTDLMPPVDWPYKTWLALIQTNDNEGPPSPESVEKLRDRARRELPGVKVRMGRLSDFGDAILQEKPNLPVVRADMPDTWIHGIMSMPQETATARHNRPRIVALEALHAMLANCGAGVPPASGAGETPAPQGTRPHAFQDTISAAYEQSLLYGEHTWGASSRFYSPRKYGKAWETEYAQGKYAFAEDSWHEHGSYALKIRELIQPPLEKDLDRLAQAVVVAGPRIVVYNPLPWQRDALVTLVDSKSAKAMEKGLKDVGTGRLIRVERSYIDGLSHFLAAQVPALGYRVYVPADVAAPSEDLKASEQSATIENQFFRVKFDRGRMAIISLFDKLRRRELVDQSSPYALGQFLYERFDNDIHQAYLKAYCKIHPAWSEQVGKIGLPPASEVKYSATSPRGRGLEIGRGQVMVEARMRGQLAGMPEPFLELRVQLFRDQPYANLQWRIIDKKPDPWGEAGWICLPLAVDQPTFHLGRVGSIIDPAKDICRGANHDVFCLASGLTVTGPEGQGVGICPLDSPLVSLGKPGLYQYTRDFTPRKPTVFVNLFNNVWGTNFQQWIGGSWTSSVRLWSVAGKGAEADLITPAWEARVPCETAICDGPAGKLPPVQTGIEISRKGVLLTALGNNPDGDGILLRLWEQAGQDGPCRVHLPAWLRVNRAQPCDLRGQPRGAAIAVHDGKLEFELPHFAPASFILGAGH